MIGCISYFNSSREFALLTPVGRSRDHDFFCAEIWWHVAGLALPYQGQLVEFDLANNADGYVEAVSVRTPRLPPPGRSTLDGAAPALPVRSALGSAGNSSWEGAR
jgi:hypothetical protein